MWEAESQCPCDVDRLLARTPGFSAAMASRPMTARVASGCFVAIFLVTFATLSLPTARTAVRGALFHSSSCGPSAELLARMPMVRAVNGTVVDDPSHLLSLMRCDWELATGAPPQCCCSFSPTSSIKKCLPHAIIVGAQKAGTTALFAHLFLRRDFERPFRKELAYFGRGSLGSLHRYLYDMPVHTPGKV